MSRHTCWLCEDARTYVDEHDVRRPCVCTRRVRPDDPGDGDVDAKPYMMPAEEEVE